MTWSRDLIPQRQCARRPVSKSLALSRGVHVRAQDPLVLHLNLVDCAQLDLVELHVEARADLVQVDVGLLFRIDVVSKGDEVALVDERDDAPRVGLRHWEEVLENGADADADAGRQVVQDQVRKGL
eukprot:3541881-Pleurochrysis_carterae.AAC.2